MLRNTALLSTAYIDDMHPHVCKIALLCTAQIHKRIYSIFLMLVNTTLLIVQYRSTREMYTETITRQIILYVLYVEYEKVLCKKNTKIAPGIKKGSTLSFKLGISYDRRHAYSAENKCISVTPSCVYIKPAEEKNLHYICKAWYIQ
jgi:hypothetical protein